MAAGSLGVRQGQWLRRAAARGAEADQSAGAAGVGRAGGRREARGGCSCQEGAPPPAPLGRYRPDGPRLLCGPPSPPSGPRYAEPLGQLRPRSRRGVLLPP